MGAVIIMGKRKTELEKFKFFFEDNNDSKQLKIRDKIKLVGVRVKDILAYQKMLKSE